MNQSLGVQQAVTSCLQAQFDLLSGVQGYVRVSNIKYAPPHIRGHQNEKRVLKDLDRLSILDTQRTIGWNNMVKITRQHRDTSIIKYQWECGRFNF